MRSVCASRRTRTSTLPACHTHRPLRRYDNKLYFYKSPSDEAHGVIDLALCLTVKSAEEKTGKPHSLEVATPDETYLLCVAGSGLGAAAVMRV